MDRRSFLWSLAAIAGGAAACSTVEARGKPVAARARLKQGACPQVFAESMPIEQRIKACAAIGILGMDYVGNRDDWPLLKKHGLTLSMHRYEYGGSVSVGRRPAGPPGWDEISRRGPASEAFLKTIHAGIDECAANGVPNIRVHAGSPRGAIKDDEAAETAIAWFNSVKAHAEDKGVTICMENVNARNLGAPVDPIFRHIDWGVKVVREVKSPSAKLLFDIYHAQIMDGFLVQTIRDNIDVIGHFHTAGVPGRHEIGANQEINYRFIAEAIADLGFKGFVSHEYLPSPGMDPIESLKLCYDVMDV